MLKDFQPRRRVTEDRYEIRFFYDENGGYAFPCDKDGNLAEMTECARKNYKHCIEHPEEFLYWNEKHHWRETHTENASGICECGNRVQLWDQYLGACECEECGRWYNLFGQSLKRPEHWEEDW